MDRRTWTPAGPRLQRCLICGAIVSTNALARASHERGNRHLEALSRKQKNRPA